MNFLYLIIILKPKDVFVMKMAFGILFSIHAWVNIMEKIVELYGALLRHSGVNTDPFDS